MLGAVQCRKHDLKFGWFGNNANVDQSWQSTAARTFGIGGNSWVFVSWMECGPATSSVSVIAAVSSSPPFAERRLGQGGGRTRAGTARSRRCVRRRWRRSPLVAALRPTAKDNPRPPTYGGPAPTPRAPPRRRELNLGYRRIHRSSTNSPPPPPGRSSATPDDHPPRPDRTGPAWPALIASQANDIWPRASSIGQGPATPREHALVDASARQCL